jgi:formylglycine-generating enzyme required for sulfatase activity
MINSAFYEKIVALDSGTHCNLRFDAALRDLEFARCYTAVPVAAHEFIFAAHEYPIVFTRGEDTLLRPMVLLGMRSAENLYVNTAGLWEASYIPVLVQHYPFVIDAAADASGVSVDEQSAVLSYENGELLIDAGGVWQPALNAETQFLQEYQLQIAATAQMVMQWDELGLFVSSDACLSFAGGDAFELRDFYVIDEALFNQLSDEVLPSLFKNGGLRLIYQHLESLQHLPRLLNLAAVRAAEHQQKLNAAKKAQMPEGVFARKLEGHKPMLKTKPVEEPSVQEDQRKQDELKKLAEQKIRVAREHRERYAQGEAEIPVEEPVVEVPAELSPEKENPVPVEARDWKKVVPVWVWGLLAFAILVLIWSVRGKHDKAPVKTQETAEALPATKSEAKTATDAVEMVRIVQGSFEMGSKKGDPDERPVQRVKIAHAFEIGKTEVTQGLWKSVMGRLPESLSFKNCGDQCPVESVSWSEVQEFISKLNAQSGKKYRLPTEAEWEYACRAGGNSTYCGSDNPDSVAWYGNDKIGKTPHPVATKAPNAWGLYDMSGNVWEWVDDCYQKHYRGGESDANASCERVLRGGSWSNDADTPRAANRYKRAANERLNNNGFRLAR